MTSRPFVVLSTAAAFALAFTASVRADDEPAPPAVAPAAEGVSFEPGTPAFADVLAKSKEMGKPVFIDFTTDWCVWCKRLDKDTYSQASVAEAMKAFVNVRIDAEKGEGKDVAKRYGVTGYPTLVVVDATGEEIDRISGYKPPKPFLEEIARIQKGEGTLAALKKAYAAAPDDVDAGVALAVKLAAAKPEESSAMFAKLAETAKTKDRPTQAKVLLEQASVTMMTARKKETMEAVAAQAEALVKDYADTPSAAHAASRLGRAVMFAGEKRTLAFLDSVRGIATDPKELFAVEELTIVVHKSAVAAALKRQGDAAGDDPQLLNNVAWNCFESKTNVKQALVWAQTAVEKSDRDFTILDTLANLLALTGKYDEAIKTEEEALAKADGAMKNEFEVNVAKWKAEQKLKGDGKKKGDDGDGEEDDGDD